jgi:hypothetical protein
LQFSVIYTKRRFWNSRVARLGPKRHRPDSDDNASSNRSKPPICSYVTEIMDRYPQTAYIHDFVPVILRYNCFHRRSFLEGTFSVSVDRCAWSALKSLGGRPAALVPRGAPPVLAADSLHPLASGYALPSAAIGRRSRSGHAFRPLWPVPRLRGPAPTTLPPPLSQGVFPLPSRKRSRRSPNRPSHPQSTSSMSHSSPRRGPAASTAATRASSSSRRICPGRVMSLRTHRTLPPMRSRTDGHSACPALHPGRDVTNRIPISTIRTTQPCWHPRMRTEPPDSPSPQAPGRAATPRRRRCAGRNSQSAGGPAGRGRRNRRARTSPR